MAFTADLEVPGRQSQYTWHDVRFIGAMPGRYTLPERRSGPDSKLEVYACRLCSISTRMFVAMAPVIAAEGEQVIAHFDEFGMIRGRAARRLPSGIVVALDISPDERDKLGAKISWQKKHVHSQVPDKREHRRILPRDPRTVVTLADGSRVDGFVIDISRSGVAVSAPIWPDIGTPMAVGRIVGRVVRYLEVGFALQFIELQPFDELEQLLQLPVG
ncbi:PilZ domain-containing protein [Devosia sp. PTR5]|uniref:PilZ domain-containing protein n=1 Tax=Devosia oryzisoli TaxID=2774138 RepID=A0A927FQT2_9HYPH|nr:PilZ domain-containing protein [Devosia oryzisoli]